MFASATPTNLGQLTAWSMERTLQREMKKAAMKKENEFGIHINNRQNTVWQNRQKVWISHKKNHCIVSPNARKTC